MRTATLPLTCTILLSLASLAHPRSDLTVVELVSVSSAGEQANNQSVFAPSLSADGRFVAFCSSASNLVPGDTNFVTDVFRRDRLTGTTIRCSIGSAGEEADQRSSGAAISGDGRYVAFWSYSDSIDPADNNGERDVYLHDTVTRATERISVGLGGAEPNGYSAWPSVDHTGSKVAFTSSASNLVVGDTAFKPDVFIRDRTIGRTALASRTLSGGWPDGTSTWPKMSADGRYVAYYTTAVNMGTADVSTDWDVYLFDYLSGATQQVSVDHAGGQIAAA